jgi:hypothetical protein
MNKSMRRTSVALLALTAGLTASAALRRFVGRRASVAAATPIAPPVAPASAVRPSDADAVVLPFARRVVAEPVVVQSATALRCGDGGGVTKAGAPCAARATAAGRCHHHRVAA